MSTLPPALGSIIDDFQALSERDRLQLLLEFSRGLPALPAKYSDHPELLERVAECQSPLFVVVEVDGTDATAGVSAYFSAPPEAPTTRGFAGILAEGFEGLSAQEILDVPDDFPSKLGLDRAVSALRMRGMSAMLFRIKHQIRTHIAAA